MSLIDQKLKIIIILTLVATAIGISAFVGMSNASQEQTTIIAFVNGAPIYSNQLAAVSEDRIAKFKQLGSKLSTDGLKRSLQLRELDNLIGQELLAQAGANFGSKNMEQRLEKRLTALLANSKENPPQPLESLKKNLRKDILREDCLEQKGLLNAKVDEQEIYRFYQDNRRSFTEPKSVKVRHILVVAPTGSPAKQEQEARNKAEKILAEINNGKSFAEVARQASECSTNTIGGDLGFIKQGFMPKEFDALAFSLKPGETSDIVKTRYGFHIIKVEEVRSEKVNDFANVKEYIANYLQKEYQRKKVDEFIQELKKNAKIEILLK